MREQAVQLPPGLAPAGDATPAGPAPDAEPLILTALMKVLSTVTAEKTVAVGYFPAAGPDGWTTPHTLTVQVPDGSWRDVVAAVCTGREQASADRPVDHDGTPHDIVLDMRPSAAHADTDRPIPPAPDTALQVIWTADTDRPELRLRHRTDIIDATYAARLAAYVRTAVEQLTTTPDAEHHLQDLLSDEERKRHVTGLAGPVRPLPEAMFPQLFEARVRAHPHVTAVSHGETSWDYAALNAAANRVAAALLAQGLRAEDVVAVVMDRTLPWAAAVLGVLKAGGAYLPVRPDFPARRVATQFDRSACRFVLGQRSARALIETIAEESGRARTSLVVEDLLQDGADPGDPGVEIRPDQLAYVYFTSGSTGAPKGAQCEHAGMVNHLYAKIDSVDLHEGDVVSQTASQCFDISLWQLVAPLLVGASARIVDTGTQLDPERFLAELDRARVSVAQLVPSYFEILLGELERRPRDLGVLRSISITGEALKLDPVRRWFVVQPHVRLVNAYGATEVSDDTMHEVLTAPPVRDFVSVGRSLRNVRTYILNDHGRLAPLGTPGEIVFAGVAVGRGYINDAERTRQAFVADPYVPGERMYRTGDFGRWLPEGTIEFLGRRDQQVKIRGYRIEIGEIENKLRAAVGVRDCAVLVEHTTGTEKSLVAFIAAGEQVEEEAVHRHLAALLPEYMVPSPIHRLDTLPLNENGKVDKKALAALAQTLGHAQCSQSTPETPTERWLATEWAEALGIPVERIGRRDHFFALGATSLTAVRLVVKLDRAVSLKQLIATPVLTELAALIDSGAAADAPGHDLLQQLADPVPNAVATLVCFPYAGGNAVNFQLLAKRLAEHRVTVLGVEPPARDFTGAAELPQDVVQIAHRVHDEIRLDVTGPIMLWGHCAGSAHALATARLLEASGTELTRVFLGAMLLDPVTALEAETAEVTALSAAEITRRLLAESAYVELDRLKPERADLVGTAYRHDVCTTNAHLVALHGDPQAHRINAPVHVILAADDPSTERGPERYRDWKVIADQVELHELAEGGHYFTSTRPQETADIIGGAATADN
ncbi:amino acid adenylation domain-containing protein [Streptomyces malaysiensis subsp. malaysiensis]|uniref:Amino acid adenylation domain-containing protein n=1 Tax=Streptomyces malaysiensis TaxID=92644 RepID=A0ABX6WE59_STRMQ|nr:MULTISPECIES: amino acid adenylation domain-containing protein [Streptomyces]QPI59727.1 amino acid adenylation domain-containing protein [Streptomyces solisilvae]UHH21396.1 amino acid adenylation domain-containing protein [Streptomyces sp. HNM0561]